MKEVLGQKKTHTTHRVPVSSQQGHSSKLTSIKNKAVANNSQSKSEKSHELYAEVN